MKKIVEYVQPNPREWENQKEGRTVYFVSCNFEDGSEGSVGTASKEKADEMIAALNAIKDTEVEFELEDNGEYQGTKKWKIKAFPGKPAGGGGGGGSRSGGGGMSHAQVGVLAAASALGPRFAREPLSVELMFQDIVALSEMLTEHLFTRRKDKEEEEKEKAEAPAATAPADSLTLSQAKRIKELGAKKGLADAEAIAEFLSINALGDLSQTDAADLIELWEAGAS